LFTHETTTAARVDIRLGSSDAIARRRYERELWSVVEGCSGRP
jgi:hypothetical protein